jgi:2-oxoglutarate ferredoxin oxidoreductase subunit gamma
MTKHEVRIAGMGGQGVVTAGYILGKSACLHDGKNAIMSQSYGPEARGGACKSEVVISDGEIDYPKVVQPSVFVVISQEAYSRYCDDICEGGTIILDEDLVTPGEMKEGVRYFRVPATRIAEQLGNKVVANVVMLGAFQGLTGIVSMDSVKKAVTEMWPRFTELNIRALERGRESGERLLKESRA